MKSHGGSRAFVRPDVGGRVRRDVGGLRDRGRGELRMGGANDGAEAD